MKLALTPPGPKDLHGDRRSHGTLQHETRVDQFFDEAQFESYRQLGYESGNLVAGPWHGGWG